MSTVHRKGMDGDARTLGETVYYLVRENKQKEADFQALLRFYGRDYLLKVYAEEKRKREGK